MRFHTPVNLFYKTVNKHSQRTAKSLASGIFAYFSRLLDVLEGEYHMEFLALVIEPDENTRRVVREALIEEGWKVVEGCTVNEALADACHHRRTWALAFCADVGQTTEGNSASSSETLAKLKCSSTTATHIVVMGRVGNADAVLRAIAGGASDYIRRPCSPADVRKIAREVKQRLHATGKENARPCLSVHPSAVETNSSDPHLIGSSKAVVSIYKRVAQSLGLQHRALEKNNSANGDLGKQSRTFLITGETGTGKELVARLIHRHSEYASGAFVPVNCSTLPIELAESELFGHEQGAFTGAVKEKKGLWELADGGTLFLDEITEAPQVVLPKLLRVLQDGTIKRLGSNQWIPVDVQVIAASNRDLKRELQVGRFREDLYHRLSLFHFHLPPLRERRDDIPSLITHFAGRYASRPVQFSQDALDLLMRHQWSGNVRELENLVRAIVTQTSDETIYAIDLLPRLQAAKNLQLKKDWEEIGSSSLTESVPLENQIKELKLKTFKEALRQHRGNITRTATALGMTRPTLYKLLKELDARDFPA